MSNLEEVIGTERLRTAGLAAALVVLSALAFHGVGGFEFVGLDDPAYVSQNPHVRAGVGVDGLVWSLTTFHWGNWHPLVWWSHMLVSQLFGPAPGPHHLANLLLHAACAVALFVALVRLSGRRWPAAVVAALFAVHPLHVESVAWVSARKDTLSTLLFWLTVWFWARRVERPTPARTLAVFAAYAAGLASKSMLVTLPVVLLLFDVWPLGRLPLPGAPTGGGRGGPARSRSSRSPWRTALPPLVIEKLPLFGLALAASFVALQAQRGAGALQGLSTTSLAERGSNAVVAVALYLRKTVWPVDLAVYYPQVPRGVGETVAAAAILLAISFGAWRLRRAVPAVLVGWAFFVVTLVPVIGLVQIGAQALADRYTYLPLTGVFVAVVWGGHALLRRALDERRVPLVAGALAAVVLAGCVVGTRVQLANWRDSPALYRHTLDVTERNVFVHGMYGAWLLQNGSIGGAVEQLRAALEIDPRHVLARENLGKALTDTGRHDEAIEQFEAGLAVTDRRVALHRGLAVALLRARRVDEAIAAYERAILLFPDDARLRSELATARGIRRRAGSGAR